MLTSLLSFIMMKKACAEMLFCISKVVQKKILDRVRNSKFYGIMIDESTDVSVIGHIILFVCFVEERLPLAVFLGLIQISDEKKNSKEIYDALLTAMKEWDLNLDNFVGFGSNGASTIVGKRLEFLLYYKRKSILSLLLFIVLHTEQT